MGERGRSQLSIRGIFVDGLWQTDPTGIKEAFLDHFTTRFRKPMGVGPKIIFSFPKRLSSDQVSNLESNISRDEIRKTVWNCGDNKSPGPDDFTFEFFKKYWDLIGPDLCEAVEYFFSNGVFPNGCNTFFIALIPKVTDAKHVSDYRPISLIGGIYKVVTKILANRLAMVISDIVSNNQSAFIAGRHILDGPFIINEILDWCKRRCKKVMFFKVDFVKAYDSVRWEYLIDVLKAFGFGLNWCQWIQGTFCFAKASILVNGSPTNEFQFHRGLKQGDPLASLLFILVMESLHLSFNRVVDAGILKEMESIRNNFFIGAGPSEKNITWVAWNQVLASKEKGGLGVSSFFALNRALLLKWVWRFVSQDGSLWYHVIQAIYGVKINSHPVRYSLNWC
nr:RNA-directed DNA polymerase, eukaryota [Tanacetum cinerariifolium]